MMTTKEKLVPDIFCPTVLSVRVKQSNEELILIPDFGGNSLPIGRLHSVSDLGSFLNNAKITV